MEKGLTRVKDPLYSYTYFGPPKSTLTIVEGDVIGCADDCFDSASSGVDNPCSVTFLIGTHVYE